MRISDWSSDVCSSDLYGRCPGIGELFKLSDDQQWRDFRHVGHVARNEDNVAILTDAACKGHGEPGQERRRDGRQDDMTESLQPVRPQWSRWEENTSEQQSLMRIPYDRCCFTKKKNIPCNTT